jgi:hypothetical protein
MYVLWKERAESLNITDINFRIQRIEYPSFPQIVQPDMYNQTAVHYLPMITPVPGYFMHQIICVFRK